MLLDLKIKLQRTANKNATSIRRFCERSNQPKINISNRNNYKANLTAKETSHDSDKNGTMESCFKLVGSR